MVGSNFGYWTLGSGRTALKPRIVINKVLSTHKAKVSDEMLAYLLYHELLHEVFPTRGHDQGFRNYEAKWPDAVRLDALFDTLNEQYDLRPESYGSGSSQSP